jgi:hypothetical protein
LTGCRPSSIEHISSIWFDFGGTIRVQRKPDFVIVASAIATEVPSGTKVFNCSTAAFGSNGSGDFAEQPIIATTKRT